MKTMTETDEARADADAEADADAAAELDAWAAFVQELKTRPKPIRFSASRHA